MHKKEEVLLEIQQAITILEKSGRFRKHVIHLRVVLSAVDTYEKEVKEFRKKKKLEKERDSLNFDSEGCRYLLVEILRRAIYDWVLYRDSHNDLKLQWGLDAHEWIFEETPYSHHGKMRSREGKHLTSFLSICQLLDLDPTKVRNHIKRLVPFDILSSPRPGDVMLPSERDIVKLVVAVHAQVFRLWACPFPTKNCAV